MYSVGFVEMYIPLNIKNVTCHICIFYFFFTLKIKIFDAAKIDEIVSAELLTEENDLTGELFGIVSSVILHGPCGNQNPNAPCMKRSDHNSPECTKQYPREFLPETVVQENGYPLYRCQNNGRYHEIPDPQDRNHTFRMDNCWFVPYNPFLSVISRLILMWRFVALYKL